MKQKKLDLFLIVSILSIGVQAQTKNDSLRAIARADSMLRALPTIKVKGERPTVKSRDGKLVYDIHSLLKERPADNAFEAVKAIPGISEDNDKLQLMGQSVTVVIDGKSTTMTTEQIYALLKSIPTSRIRNAEVMLSAPARYGVRGAMVSINLRHGSSDQMPLQGEIYGTARHQHDCNYEERISLAASKGKWNFDVLYNLQHGDRYEWRNTASHHTLANGDTRDILSNSTDKSRGHNHSWRFGADYNLGNNHNLSFTYNGKYATNHQNETNANTIESENLYHGTGTLQNARADYQAPFGLKAAIEYTFYKNPSQQTLNSRLLGQEMNYLIESNQRINRWKLSIGQVHEFKNWAFNYGIHCQTSTDNSLQTYKRQSSTSADAPADTRSRQQEDIANLYAGFSKNIGRALSVDLSLAAEYYHSQVWHRWDIYPTLNLNYRPADGHMLQLSFSSQKDFPPYSVIKNSTTYCDGGYGIVTGNPNLRPLDNYATQLVYILKNKYQFSAWFNYNNHYFTQVPYQSTEQFVLNYKFLNYDFMSQWGVMASLPFRFGRRVSSRANIIGVWQKEKDTDFYDMAFNRDRAFVVLNLKNAVVICKRPDLTLNVDAKWHSTALQATYTIPPTWQADLSVQYVFAKKNATLKLYANDIFETSHPDPYIRYAGQHLDLKMSSYREVGLSFTYRFGGYKEKQHKELDTKRFEKK